MNKEETVVSDLATKQYSQKNKVRALFADLMREIIVKKPQDPIAYLIQYLQTKAKKQIICIIGYDDEERSKISNAVANKYAYRHINLSQMFKGDYHSLSDDQINSKVQKELKATQTVYKGIVISGYPSTLPQLDFIQKSKFIPLRYFITHDNPQKIKQQYQKIYHQQSMLEIILTRNNLCAKEMKGTLKNLADHLPPSYQLATQNIIHSLSFKDKKIVPLQSPRIFLMHPPYLIPKTLNSIIQKYFLYPISVPMSFNKMSSNSSFQQYVESTIRKTKTLSKQIQLALIESQCKSAAAKNKGYILIGWPNTYSKCSFLKEHFLNPHLILAFTEIQQKAKTAFSQTDSNDINLYPIKQKPSMQQFSKQLADYKSMVQKLKNRHNVQLLPLDEKQSQVLKTVQSQVQNSKIYN